MFILAQGKLSGSEILKEFTFVNKAPASVLLQFDVSLTDMIIQRRPRAFEHTTCILDSDEVVGWHDRNLLDNLLDGILDDWPENVVEKLGNGGFEFHRRFFYFFNYFDAKLK